MAQHDQVIDNGSGLTVRSDINAALAALFSSSSGPIEPATMVAGQFWYDTAGANPVVRLRNSANTGWMTLFDSGNPANFSTSLTLTGDGAAGMVNFNGAAPVGLGFGAADMAWIARTSPNRLCLNDAANGAGTDVATFTDTGNETLVSTDPGATAGPILVLDRNSASPAAADVLGEIDFRGRSSTALQRTYAKIYGRLSAPTNAAEVGEILFENLVAGASQQAFRLTGADGFIGGNFSTSGNFTAGGNVTANQNFSSSTGIVILGATGAGTIFFRPNGVANTAAQASYSSGGQFSISANVADPIYASSPQGQSCRVNLVAANIRSWKAGVATGGEYWISDESGATVVLRLGNTANLQSILSGGFTVTGSAWKPGGGPWADSSDERIKNVIGPYDPGLAELKQLNPILYTFKGNDTNEEPSNGYNPDADPDTPEPPPTVPYPNSPHFQVATDGTQFVGLVAQEVEAIFPGMVSKRTGYIDGEQVDDLRDLNTTNMIFALVNAVKELAARVEALEAK